MKRVLITGANRGLGLAFADESLDRGYRVFASCRHPDEAVDLQSLTENHPARLTVLSLDVTEEKTIEASARLIRSHENGLDLLLNNAGVNPSGERPGNLDAATMLRTFHVNTVGPLLVAERHLDLLRAGDNPTILNISSILGSLARKTGGGGYSYSGSKAALNMLTRALAFDLKSDGVIVVSMHPGWAQTDMGGSGAPLKPEESVRGILDVADGLTLEDTGSFLNHRGRQLPW